MSADNYFFAGGRRHKKCRSQGAHINPVRIFDALNGSEACFAIIIVHNVASSNGKQVFDHPEGTCFLIVIVGEIKSSLAHADNVIRTDHKRIGDTFPVAKGIASKVKNFYVVRVMAVIDHKENCFPFRRVIK